MRSLVKSERNDGRMVEFTRANVNGQLGRSFDETRGNGTRVFSSPRLRKKGSIFEKCQYFTNDHSTLSISILFISDLSRNYLKKLDGKLSISINYQN